MNFFLVFVGFIFIMACFVSISFLLRYITIRKSLRKFIMAHLHSKGYQLRSVRKLNCFSKGAFQQSINIDIDESPFQDIDYYIDITYVLDNGELRKSTAKICTYLGIIIQKVVYKRY